MANRSEMKHRVDCNDSRPVKKTKLEHDRFRQTAIRCYEDQENGSVNFATFNPIYPILACGLVDGTILIIEGKNQTDPMNLWNKKNIFKTERISVMTDLAWNTNGNLLTAAFLDGKMSIWHRNDEKFVEVGDPDGEQVWAIAWNRHLPNLFVTRNNQTILVWGDAECSSPEVLKPRFGFHTNIIRDVAWISYDQFASCSDDGSILLCQIGKDSPLKSLSLGDAVLSLSWNSSSNLLASLTRDGSIEVWSMDKNNSDYVLSSTRPKRPNCFAWYSIESTAVDKNTIACGLEDGSVIVWNIGENRDTVRSLREQTSSIWSVSFSPDGQFLASIDLQGDIVIWSTEDWKITFQSKLSYRASKQTLLWGADGHKLAFANPSQQIHIIEATEEK